VYIPLGRSGRQPLGRERSRWPYLDSPLGEPGDYGCPRIYQDLQAQQVDCSRNRVVRIMRKYEITARPLRRSVKTTDSSHSIPIASNLLEWKFSVGEPNTRWSADITYLWTGEGCLYLAVVMDLYSRQAIGWSLQETLDRSLTLSPLRDALMQRKPRAGLICHSDRGANTPVDTTRRCWQKSGRSAA
jgi:transposase InsO family protein